MTGRTIQTLVAIVIGLALLLVVIQSNDREGIDGSGRPLLPDFKTLADSITHVRVLQAGEAESVTIERIDEKWVVSARDGYAADVAKLRTLIIALADARIIEEKTSNPTQYNKLSVDDPENGGKGTKLILTGSELSYAVILGNTVQRNYRYARLADGDPSYLVNQNPELPLTPGDWLRPDIIDIGSGQVQRVVVTHADGETIVIEKVDQEQTDFSIQDVPDGRELSYATVGNGIAGALDKLELEDVRERIDAVAATTTIYETWDGLCVIAEVVSENETSWVTFTAEITDEDSTAGDQVAEINERLGRWQYRLADYKKNLLVRRWDDLLKTENTAQN